MSLNRLGHSDLEITSIGLGTNAWSGRFGALDDAELNQAVKEGVDAGINWIHTAPGYGRGQAEGMVGRAVRALPASSRPYVFSTCWRRFDPDNADSPPVIDLSPAGIRFQVEGSLGRLGIDRLDLLQFHWPDPDVPIEESWGFVGDLIGEGKVRAAGLSNHPVELLERAEAVRHIDAIQPPLSLLDRSMNGPRGDSGGPDVLPWAHAHETGVIVFGPMQHGLLTGAFSLERAAKMVDEGESLRPELYWFKEPELSRALALVEGLRPIAQRLNTTVAAVAVAWVLAWPGVTGAIVGARKPGQVAGFIDAMDLRLSDADLGEIAGLIESTRVGEGNSGDGPSRPPLV